eukprot:CAMPEP_0170062902 /NCGR_PEP_ID=MMETSP0019_2-20121128/3962_1 /TAXON_ID=98059 /ORGANISM="Dinobryon sp., Strain UTEXLB2267" /LENGTH=341 /DNA_ID=CAMNT_0010269181 /DNA_START=583 /DNA_END=1605 /DNA_ORIENTATION=+
MTGHYHEEELRLDAIYLYECLVTNMSQLWALYCLIFFYFAMKEELAVWRPVGKFLCVKMVVFFTWWQSIVIYIVSSYTDNIINPSDQWTTKEIANGIQDYLICIEMFFASIAFTFAFTYKDYLSKRGKHEDDDSEEVSREETEPFLSAFLQSSMPDDILADLRRFARSNGLIQLQSYETMNNDSTTTTSPTVLNSNNNNNNNIIVNRCSSPIIVRSNSISEPPQTISKNNINNLTKMNHSFGINVSNVLILNGTENESSDNLFSSINSDGIDDIVDDISIEDVDLESNCLIKENSISNSNVINPTVVNSMNINNNTNLATHPKEGLNHVNDPKNKIFRWAS